MSRNHSNRSRAHEKLGRTTQITPEVKTRRQEIAATMDGADRAFAQLRTQLRDLPGDQNPARFLRALDLVETQFSDLRDQITEPRKPRTDPTDLLTRNLLS